MTRPKQLNTLYSLVIATEYPVTFISHGVFLSLQLSYFFIRGELVKSNGRP